MWRQFHLEISQAAGSMTTINVRVIGRDISLFDAECLNPSGVSKAPRNFRQLLADNFVHSRSSRSPRIRERYSLRLIPDEEAPQLARIGKRKLGIARRDLNDSGLGGSRKSSRYPRGI